MLVKENTKEERQFVARECSSCGIPFQAPVHLRTGELIGDGVCAGCIRERLTAKTQVCPVCHKEFPVQAGHRRATCGRPHQKLHSEREAAKREIERMQVKIRQLDAKFEEERKKAKAATAAKR